MGEPDLVAIAAGPAGADHLAVGGGEDRRAVAGAEIDALVHPRIAEDRVEAEAEIGRDVARHRPLQHAALAADAGRLEPFGAAALLPLHQLQVLARAAVEAGVEEPAGLGLAGGGAAMLEDDVEAVVGGEAADVGLAGERADIGLDRARRNAGGPRRAVEAGADEALDPQRRLVDRDRDRGSAPACRPTRLTLEPEVEAGAKRERCRAAGRRSGSGRRPSVRSRSRCRP